MFMYVMLFAAGIRLRFKDMGRRPGFMIPGGKLGMTVVAGAGIIGSIVTVLVGFIPPDTVGIGSHFRYECLIVGGLVVMSLPAIWTYLRKNR
jgi:glutamate:GABA antiporter